MRGVYILYDNHHRAFYCGIAGKGKSNARARIRHHLKERYLGAKIHTFSVYDINKGVMRQIETLILHALGAKHWRRWNRHLGRFLKTARKVSWQKTSRSEAARRAWVTRRRNGNA
ncbi:MAG: GIY-YIG nuclease family protein [Thaumarchaeota archaeon]|nr:GIY-YIG nuclease family protein [Nitrososphaerota archaeon]